ncbi:thiamine-phosphate kinase [Paenibacillaceae bacterium]|nr:thiamine-phosphate kinase [Paenibacillaceae bacterium]
MDEFASIRYWTANRQPQEWLRARGVAVGIGDDAAVVDLAPESPVGQAGEWQCLLTVDTMVETVHFTDATMSDEDIGYKALAASISDIAAMGGLPRHALVSVSLPPSCGPERMRRLYDGLYACADTYGVAIVGGDTTSTPSQLVVAVTVVGAVEAGKAVRRAGARAGDTVFVTGLPGQSAAGLHFLLAAAQARARAGLDGPVPLAAAADAEVDGLVAAHRRPRPSVRAGRLLAARGTCRSLNDVSDGLASEAWELAEASGVSIVLREAALPCSGSMAAYGRRVGVKPLDWILYGGEDYVLIGTIDPQDAQAAKAALNAEGIPFYAIGEVEAASVPGVWLERDGDWHSAAEDHSQDQPGLDKLEQDMQTLDRQERYRGEDKPEQRGFASGQSKVNRPRRVALRKAGFNHFEKITGESNADHK